jgi:hypothetical protein
MRMRMRLRVDGSPIGIVLLEVAAGDVRPRLLLVGGKNLMSQ